MLPRIVNIVFIAVIRLCGASLSMRSGDYLDNGEYATIMKVVKVLQEKVSDLTKDNAELKQISALQNRRIRTLEQQMQEMESRNDLEEKRASKRIRGLQGIMPQKLQEDASSFIPFVEKRHQTLGELTTFDNAHKTRSAFYAMLKANLPLGDSQLIKFEDIKTNIGDDYERTTSIYTCSINGTYVFQHTVLVEPGHYLQTLIKKNDEIYAYTFARDTTYHGTGTSSCIINLTVGDRVWVEVDLEHHSKDSMATLKYTTFSGFLLYPM